MCGQPVDNQDADGDNNQGSYRYPGNVEKPANSDDNGRYHPDPPAKLPTLPEAVSGKKRHHSQDEVNNGPDENLVAKMAQMRIWSPSKPVRISRSQAASVNPSIDQTRSKPPAKNIIIEANVTNPGRLLVVVSVIFYPPC
jgi:hypothetical protein